MYKEPSKEVYIVAILIAVILIGLLGWWAFSWSTHTLVWLGFMGFTLESWAQNSLIKRNK